MTRWPDAIDLGGDGWQFGSVAPRSLWRDDDLHQVTDWRAAVVPGNLEADLARLGVPADPCAGPAWGERQQIENRDWWYRRDVEARLQPAQRAHLVLHGVDYYSSVHANGARLGSHEGMFSSQVYDVTRLLADARGRFDLAVRLWGAHALPRRRLAWWQRLVEPALARLTATDMFPERTRTLKCQMSFGWDFAPHLRTIGIWDDAELIISGPIFIGDVRVQAQPRGAGADVSVHLALNAAAPARARVALQVHDAGGAIAAGRDDELTLPAGDSEHTLEMTLPDARLWQPFGRGEQHLYSLTVAVEPSGGALVARAQTTFGVRSIELGPIADRSGGDWSLRVNGRRLVMRGANWTPVDVLPGRVRPADYEALIGMARAANCNVLRVWGGGLREKSAFYDLCDRMGMLVWQDFPFACPNMVSYPRSAAYLSLVEQECTAIVRTLRHHPSVFLWCGGNEFSPRRNRHVVDALRRIVGRHDPDRPFHTASPFPGDSHNWRVWHHRAPLHAYRRDTAQIVSEFGLQAVPGRAQMSAAVGEAALWPPGPAWTARNAEIGKLQHYAATFLPPGDASFDAFAVATQQAQATGVQIMVEHMRRRGAGGVLVWQLNEPWPCICWSLVTYDRQPKLAYGVLQRVYNPVLLSLDYEIKPRRPGETFSAVLWLINDRDEAVAGAHVVVTLNGVEVHAGKADGTANGNTRLGALRFTLPDAPPPWLLHADVWQGDALLSHNEYDLGYCDERAMPLVRRGLALIGRWLLH